MFQDVERTAYAPRERPVMVWDGRCGFCKYWISVWKSKTGEKLLYQTYQESASDFGDIPEEKFREAVRLIEQDGQVYGGPDAAFRSMFYYPQPITFWHKLYRKVWLFRKISDYGYWFVTSHRPFMLTLSKMMWGSNPADRKSYWLAYVTVVAISILIILFNNDS